MLEFLSEALLDSTKLLPFLFSTYLVMELLEHQAREHSERLVKQAGIFGPVFGSLAGAFPQCGFSAAASSLYAGRLITVGTLISIYLATSDEMLPILISESVPAATIFRILGAKVVIGMVSGFGIEFVYTKLLHRKEPAMDVHSVCEQEHCDCKDSILLSALKHTLKIYVFLFIVTLAIQLLIALIGEETLSSLLTAAPVVGQLLAGLVGLIPNCAASVVITQLYLEGIITAGAMMSGLLVGAGVGLLILFRLNHHLKENLSIAAALYATGVVWGILIDFAGITF